MEPSSYELSATSDLPDTRNLKPYTLLLPTDYYANKITITDIQRRLNI